ncbi:IS66 Orf2 like protein [Stieleria neptunia]|uniref:IS66 Orf2 like protein n=2 Tax=Stieleria TaxID=2795973 RepID=A0A518HZW6_9BACT|nr:IS66 family insertion sequence element accessory protein TnpB [Stieleria neptunia]QDV40658.1 IS66 Orf2 like protein [Stieleria neptunia]QDV42504.1 IS66 Orf2 like protein [Stieleria neptunia]QDV43576.1 IS66 Orf2 like protein [Stieleria neptunia]QDV43808.1 IS66 Orf2 like protein [Stieleria neptunia]QDV44988.1 IS66 Orf2 like protein [Stieleria neptunia]
MIALPTTGGIFLYAKPTDMRKSFSGLAGIVRNELGKTPNDGSLFLFINRRQDKLKALYWDRDGMAVWYKSLEQGTFERIRQDGEASVKLDAADLAMLLGGISIENAKRRKRLKAA